LRLYLDTSALLKLYVDEEESEFVRQAAEGARFIATSVLAYVEARAALVRRRHQGDLSPIDYRRLVRDLEADWSRYLTVEVSASILRDSARLSEVHRLRAYDAIHLASASTVKGHVVEPFLFGCWDHDLERAARREGFELLRGRK
jgi:predicted nucleic acid-binding protein